MRVYLASPFFNTQQRVRMRVILNLLRDSGYEVYAPFEHKIEDGEYLSNDEWGANVFEMDVEELDECDTVVAICDGYTGDTGTAWEMGYAYATRKPVFACCLKDEIHSLMLMNCLVGSFLYDEAIQNRRINLKNYLGRYVREEQK